MGTVKPLTVAEALNQALKTFRKNYDGDLADDLNVRWNAEDLIADEWPQYKDKPFRTVWDDEGDNPAWCHLTVKFLGCKTFDDDVYQYFIGGLEEIRNGPRTVREVAQLGTPKTGDGWTSPGRMVCSWPGIDPSARLVLFAMVAYGDNQGRGIFVSQQTVANVLGYSTTEPIRRAQLRLRKSGALTRLSQGRHGKPTQWRLNRFEES